MDDKYEQDSGYSAVYTAPQSSGCTGPEPEKKQKKTSVNEFSWRRRPIPQPARLTLTNTG